MERKDFLRAAVAGVAAAALPFPRPRPIAATASGQGPSPQPGAFQKWTWVRAGGDRTPEEWRDQYRRLAENGFTGVLVSGGDTATQADAAHAAGLEFHRWVWTLNRSGDAWVKSNHPEWFTVSRNGDSSLEKPPYVGYYQWLCPSRPEVRAYLRDVMLAIARDPDVDGLHLDYVRHCDVILPRGLWSKYDLVQDREYPQFDFCYCDVCRASFASQYDRDPLELPDPTVDEDWRRSRWDSISGLVRVLSDAVHALPSSSFGSTLIRRGPPVGTEAGTGAGTGKPVTAAVFPTPTIARELVRQAWDQWPVDAVFPMLYHSFYEEDLAWIGRGVEEGLAALETGPPQAMPSPGEDSEPEPRRLFAGLYLPALSEEERLRALEIAREAGAHGVSFFELGGLEI